MLVVNFKKRNKIGKKLLRVRGVCEILEEVIREVFIQKVIWKKNRRKWENQLCRNLEEEYFSKGKSY